MSARHSGTIGSQVKTGKEKDGLLFKELQKLQTTQLPVVPTLHPVAGRGIAGGGTQYPLWLPAIDIGIISIASIDINLANPNAHYTKILDDVSDLTINFINLISDRAIVFTVDITIQTASFNSLTFVPSLSELPTGLPTLQGSRFALIIVGFKTASDERFTVINSGNTSSGVSGDNLGNHIATQALNMSVNLINNVVDPIADQDAATRKFVEDSIQTAIGGDGGIGAKGLVELESKIFVSLGINIS